MSRDSRPKPPRIVAELGRPETPAETAARKAENSRVHRQAQNTRNLIVALVASLGLVLVLVMVVARPDASTLTPVDHRAEAAAAETRIGHPIALPELPDGWYANRADVRSGTLPGSWQWYLGLVTADEDYIAVQQAFGEDERWLGEVLSTTGSGRGSVAPATGTTDIGGIEWTVIDRRDQRDTGNFAYTLWTETDTGFVIIHGTAADSEFEETAAAVAARLLD